METLYALNASYPGIKHLNNLYVKLCYNQSQWDGLTAEQPDSLWEEAVNSPLALMLQNLLPHCGGS